MVHLHPEGMSSLDPARSRPARLLSRRQLSFVVAVSLLLAGAAIAALIGLDGVRPHSNESGPIPRNGPRSLPAIAFEDRQGRQLKVDDFRGKVVLLNVWATWCAPCREEMPTLDRLQEALGGPGFEVVALSIDRGGSPAAEAFFSRIGVRSLKTYVDKTGAAMRSLSVVGLPTTLLIDVHGREVGRLTGPAVWDSPEIIAQIRRQIAAPRSS